MLEIILHVKYAYECLGERSPCVPYLLKSVFTEGAVGFPTVAFSVHSPFTKRSFTVHKAVVHRLFGNVESFGTV
jgi:hypothetical protein